MIMNFTGGPGGIIGRGYVVEFWIKLDRLNEFCSISPSKYKYYFIGDPHVIYYDPTDAGNTSTLNNSNFGYNIYYQLLTMPSVKVKLTNISQFNWNHVSIHVDLVNRNLKVITNFNYFNPEVKIEKISSGINLNFSRIMFCSNSNCNTLFPGYLTNIEWGAAFYKNIRISDGINYNPWTSLDYYSSTFSDNLTTQFFDYPFSLNKTIDNNFSNLRGNFGSFDFYNIYGFGSLYNTDKDFNFNYGSTFDYSETNINQYLSSVDYTTTRSISTGGCQADCRKCTDVSNNKCTECTAGAKLYGARCKKYTGYYLKMPITNYSDRFLSLNLSDLANNFYIEKENVYTITLWIKYHGQLLSNKNECLILFRFTTDGRRYICYNSQNLSLYFYEGTSILYEDKSFTYNIGQWTMISMSSFQNVQAVLPNLNNYFDYLYRFYVNNQEIVRNPSVNVPAPGWKFDAIDIGFGFSALIADIKIYRNFIVNPWGYYLGPKKTLNVIYEFLLNANTADGECLKDNRIKYSLYDDIKLDKVPYPKLLGVQCKPDYSPYFTGSSCSSSSFFDNTNLGKFDVPCTECNKKCIENCANDSDIGCTCDFNSANHALRIDDNSKKLFCETLPYTDFSKFEVLNIENIKVAKEREYSIEFWYYLYTYTNSTTAAFDGEEIIWDDHNKIRIYNFNNSIYSGCTPVFSNGKAEQYLTSEKSEIVINGFYNWVYITCSVNLNTNTFYNYRGNTYNVETRRELIPDVSNKKTTRLIIQPSKYARANYGYLFLKDIKLWSMYNIKRFYTKCYPPSGLPYIEELLHYFRNEKFTNTITDDITGIIGSGTKRTDFVGYNILNLKTRESMIQQPFKICSIMNVYPSTGVINDTKFTVQSRENENFITNYYRFTYNIKGISPTPIPFGNTGTRDVNVIFQYPDIPETTQEILIEIFCEITPITGDPYVIYKKIKVYKKIEFTGNFNYNNILQTLTINNGMSMDMILDAQKSLSKLETDLPYQLNTTSFKPSLSYNANGTINVLPPTCDENSYCNNRGFCYVVAAITYCKCKNGFKGKFCQISEINLKYLNEYSKNLSDVVYYKVYNNTNFTNSDAISKDLIENIYLEFDTNIKSSEEPEDLSIYINTLNLLLNNTANGNVGEQIKLNQNYLVTMVNKMFDFVTSSLFKTKYNNLNNQIISMGIKNDSLGKYTIRTVDLNPNNTINSTNATGGNGTSLKNRILKDYNYRHLQANSSNLTVGDTTAFIIDVKDPKILTLNSTQVDFYKDKFNEIKILLDNVIKNLIKINPTNPVKFSQRNDMLNFTLDYFTISDFNNFDFSAYFKDRVDKNQTYFDAKKCIQENLNKLTKENLNYFYINYIFYDIPMYTLDPILSNNSLSLSHSLTLYDPSGTQVNLDNCSSEILHYISLYPNQPDFIRRLLISPEKYEKNDEIYKSKKYMPFFIFPNGTIDHINTLNQQIDIYYRQYQVNINEYTVNNFYTSTNSGNLTSYFKYTLKNNYIVAGSRKSGEFAAFAYFDPSTGPMANNYYIDYNQIFRCSDNYKQNMCFILVIVLLGVNFLCLIGFISLKTCFRRYKDDREWSKAEEEQLKKDNLIFGDNRFSFINFSDRNFDNTFYQNKSNISKNKNGYSLAEENNQNNVIIPVVRELENSNNKKNNIEGNVINPKKNSAGEDLENNKDNDEENNKIIINENKKISSNDEQYYIQELNKANDQKIEIVVKDEKFNSEENIGTGIKKYSRIYALFHFIVFRNFYMSFVLLTSPFSPKYKTYSKIVFLVYLELLTVVILFIFGPFDLIYKSSNELDKTLLTSYVFYSVLFSNAILLTFSLIYKVNDRKSITCKNNNFLGKEMTYIIVTNIIKTTFINVLNISLLGGLFYISFGFCSVWKDHAGAVLVLWILTLIADFLLMELGLEGVILFFYSFRKLHKIFLYIMKFWLALKNLRNHH